MAKPQNNRVRQHGCHETELKTLMLATQRGDAAAYRTLLAKLVPRFRAYYKRRMMRALRGAEEAEDLVQETLLAVHLKRDTYDPEALFTPWLHAIVRGARKSRVTARR
jgi:RNA polymerase sigma-70 factor, ECF subfamily